MANFKPDEIPTQSENFLQFSRPIDTPRLQSPVGSLLSGIGNLFEGGVKAADQYVKDKIKSEVSDVVGIQQDADINYLEGVRDRTSAATAGISVGEDSDTGSVEGGDVNTDISGQSRALPQPVQDSINTAGTMTAANRARRMGDTEYYNRLNALTRQLITRYPTYADEIRAEFRKLLGVDPTNAYRRSLQNDIAASQVTDKAVDNYLEKHQNVINTLFPGSSRQWQKEHFQDVQVKTDKYTSELFQKKTQNDLRMYDKNARADTKEEAIALANDSADLQTRAHFEGLVHLSEEMKNTPNPTPEQISGWQLRINQMKLDTETSLKSFLSQPQFRAVPQEEKQKIIEASTKMFNTPQEMLSNGQYGQMGAWARTYTAKNNQALLELWKRYPDIGNMTVILQHLGPAGTVFADRILADPKIKMLDQMTSALRSNLLSVIVSQPGQTPTLSDQFKVLKETNPKEAGRATSELIRQEYELAMDSKLPPETASKVFRSLWDPKFFEQVNDEQKPALLTRLASPAVSARITELAKTDPQLAEDYKRFVTDATKSLFVIELNNVAGVISNPGSAFKLTFKNGQFQMTPVQTGPAANAPIQLRPRGVQRETGGRTELDDPEVRSVQKLNSILRMIAPAFAVDGQDPNAGLEILLQKTGADPRLKKDTPLINRIMDAIGGLFQTETPAEPSPVIHGGQPGTPSPGTPSPGTPTPRPRPDQRSEAPVGVQQASLNLPSEITQGLSGVQAMASRSPTEARGQALAYAPSTLPENLEVSPRGGSERSRSPSVRVDAHSDKNLFSSGRAQRMGIVGGVGQNLTQIDAGNGRRVTVNSEAAPHFQGFLDELQERGYNISEIGGYSNRNKVGARGKSEHAFGNAIDINPGKNPQGGTDTDLPPDIRQIAAKYGLIWGGDWRGSSKDPMHFEWSGRNVMPTPRTQVTDISGQSRSTQDQEDYDYAAAEAAGVKPDARGHMPDTYKKPNHITFSDESIYNGKDGNEGGHWEQLPNGRWMFTPGPTNLKNYSPSELRNYFRKNEPDAILNMPDPKTMPTDISGQSTSKVAMNIPMDQSQNVEDVRPQLSHQTSPWEMSFGPREGGPSTGTQFGTFGGVEPTSDTEEEVLRQTLEAYRKHPELLEQMRASTPDIEGQLESVRRKLFQKYYDRLTPQERDDLIIGKKKGSRKESPKKTAKV